MNSTIRRPPVTGNHGKAQKNIRLRGYFTANPLTLLHFYYAVLAAFWLAIIVGLLV